jgi:hypothetical protein
MSVHVYVFLLVVCLLLCPTLLWRLDWFPLRPSSSSGGTKRTTLQRLLKPRTPDDCPACRLGSTPSLGGEPAPAPVRPWCEVKSRRGAPKRVNTQGWYFHWLLWINRPALCKPTSDRFLVMRQSSQVFSSQSEAPSEFSCWHIHQSLRVMLLHSFLALMPLKWAPVAMGRRAPRASSIVGWFCRLPSRASAAGSVAPDVCLLVLLASRAPLGVIRDDARSDSKLATTPGGRAGTRTAVPSPKSDEPEQLFHVGESDSPAR